MPKAPETKENKETGFRAMIAGLCEKFLKESVKLPPEERQKRIGRILFVAAVGRFFGMKQVAEVASKTKGNKKPKKKDSEEVKEVAKKAEPKKEDKPEEPREAVPRQKTYEELAKIPNVNERVVKVTEQMVKDKTTGLHCWDWCDKVYKAANVKRGSKGYFSCFKKYEKDEDKRDCGKHCAKEKDLDQIEPGAHIFVNNQNSSDTHGNHSVIFLKWVNKEKRIAKAAGCPWTGKPAKIYTYDLSPVEEKDPSRKGTRHTPVVAISNPA